MLGPNDLKPGTLIEHDGAPCRVETVKVSAPTARGGNTITRVRLRNLRTKQKIDASFRGNETFAEVDFEKRACQLLFTDGAMYTFMDDENYEQFAIHKDDLDWELKFLREEMTGIQALRADEELLGIELPNTVSLTISDTAPGIKGASATARTKPATLETGHVVQVPEYIENGTAVNVDTRTGDYLGRTQA